MYVFKSPESERDWADYHRVRRQVLWEARGKTDYDANRPGEHKANHYPKMLFLDGEVIGVVRIDLVDGVAWLRKVAIAEHHQRKGHGRVMMGEVEKFVMLRGVYTLRSSVAVDAVGFYRKMGFEVEGEGGTQMHKALGNM